MEIELNMNQLNIDSEEYVNKIIYDSLKLYVAESKAYTLKNLQVLQLMINNRFYHIKQNLGKVFIITSNGNEIIITRYEDEVVR